MTRKARLLDVVKGELERTLDDVLPRRLGNIISQNDWEALRTEVMQQLLARAEDNHLIGEIVTEGDLKTHRGAINVAGFIETLEAAMTDQTPAEQMKITHLLSNIKRAADNIAVLRKRR